MAQLVYPKNTPDCIHKFVHYFEKLNQSDTPSLPSFYDESIVFKDPVHHIESIPSISSYFEKLNKNLKSGGFTFTSIRIVEDKCYLEWDMGIELYRPKKKVSTSGISVLSFANKITHHRDYFDAGELFYENVPILGAIIKSIKRKLSNG